MKRIKKYIAIYFQQFDDFNRNMKSKGYDVPLQSLFPFLSICGIVGGLLGIYIGINENDFGVLFSALLIIIIAGVCPFILNKGINFNKNYLRKK